jgi:hypothetical protein
MAKPLVKPKGSRHPWLVFLPFALPFVILAAAAVYGATAPSTLPAPGSQGRLVWGPGIFTSRSEFKTLLVARGGNYKHWAKLHPAALRLLPRKHHPTSLAATPAHRVKRPKHATPPPKPSSKQAPTASRSASPRTRVASTWSSGLETTFVSLMLWLMIAAGVLFGAAAVAPERIFRRLGVGGRIPQHDARVISAAAGVALLVGVIVATQLG